MNIGQVRDRFPRITLDLPGRNGPLSVEFVVDTGFDGELSIPADIAHQVDRAPAGNRSLYLADGSPVICPYYEIEIEWREQIWLAELLVLDGNPLLGVVLLDGFFLQIEMFEGGEVRLEPP